MALNISFITALVELLENDYFDEVRFNKFISTKGARGFMDHENIMGRCMDIRSIKDELKRLVECESYEDKYNFHILKNNLKKLKKDIYYFYGFGDRLVKLALNRVYRVVSDSIEVKTDIYLYAGGSDGGFTVDRKEIYINLLNYIGEVEELIKILSHELYHSRKIPIRYRLKFGAHLVSRRKRYAYGLLGRIVEEGIACLVQHGPILIKDDKTGNLTRRNLSLSKVNFDMLNEILMDMKMDRYDRGKLNNLNIYAVGYIIITTVYREKGVVLLDKWTVNMDFRDIIKEYISLRRANKMLPEIKSNAIDWIIS